MPNETEVHIFREVSKWIDCAVYFNIEGRKRWRERERKEKKTGEKRSTRKRIENGNCCTTLNTRDLGQPEGKKNLCRTRKWMCPRLKYIQHLKHSSHFEIYITHRQIRWVSIANKKICANTIACKSVETKMKWTVTATAAVAVSVSQETIDRMKNE